MAHSEVAPSERLSADPFKIGSTEAVSDNIAGARHQSEHLSEIFEALESRITAGSDGFVNAVNSRVQDLLSEDALGEPLESIHQSLIAFAKEAEQSDAAEMRAHLDAHVQCVSQVGEALKPAQGNGLSDEERVRASETLLSMLDHGPFPPEVLAMLAPQDDTDPQFAQLVQHASTDPDLTKAAECLNWDDIQMSPDDAARIFQEMMEETGLHHLMQ
eukprot:gnl/MRDRNA2_/MRDRNA2_96588_c0_seq1.p1 gnl/MRDRNA2_/MRDRNA2_96588_c0~~gnl/MRDRNA2_/MRDRNA2_96588_c0_seq1.p1  ORF type:complete len:216 (+),score=52.66 gnl/MRDRNA2_/MRDRNA2_96588_c0_seq1:80-727(+)